MMRKIVMGLMVLSLSILHCKTPKDVDQSKERLISFGSFGGFAGSYTEYTIYSDGSLTVQKSLKGDNEVLNSLELPQVKQFVSILDQLQKENYQISDPGNMSYFIRDHQNEPVQEYLWGARTEKCDERLLILHKSLTQLCKERFPIM